jgi:hypothetical protein
VDRPGHDCGWNRGENVHLTAQALKKANVDRPPIIKFHENLNNFEFMQNRSSMANTKSLSKEDRKKAKRAARKKAAPKAKRTTPRGSQKRKVKKLARGTAKR